jgi:hypothetical protein
LVRHHDRGDAGDHFAPVSEGQKGPEPVSVPAKAGDLPANEQDTLHVR